MGFKKQGRNYLRNSFSYIECVSIQGSSWNSGYEPWHFYVNVSVALNDIPLREKSKFHAGGRLEALVPEAAYAFDLTERNLESLAREISDYIKIGCSRIPDTLDNIMPRALLGLYSPLPVPQSWLDEKSDGNSVSSKLPI